MNKVKKEQLPPKSPRKPFDKKKFLEAAEKVKKIIEKEKSASQNA